MTLLEPALLEPTVLEPTLVKPKAGVTYVGSAAMPVDAGDFTAHAFDAGAHTHLVLTMGDLTSVPAPLVRLHSECLTGDALRSRRCDCGSQLQAALTRIADEGVGAVIYLAGHEGRGIGLAEKIRAYALQDDGADTVDANVLLGHDADQRDYTPAVAVLDWYGVKAVRLLTNNPTKAAALQEQGIHVAALESHHGMVTEHNRAYLETKRDRMGHELTDLQPSHTSARGPTQAQLA